MAMAKSTIIPFTLTASVDLTDVRSEIRALAEGLLRSLGDSYYAERERGDIATIDAATPDGGFQQTTPGKMEWRPRPPQPMREELLHAAAYKCQKCSLLLTHRTAKFRHVNPRSTAPEAYEVLCRPCWVAAVSAEEGDAGRETEPAQVAAPAKPIRFDDDVITPISPMKDSDSGPVIVEASILRDGCAFIEVGYHGIHLDESNTIAVRDLLNGIIAAGEEIKRKTDA